MEPLTPIAAIFGKPVGNTVIEINRGFSLQSSHPGVSQLFNVQIRPEGDRTLIDD